MVSALQKAERAEIAKERAARTAARHKMLAKAVIVAEKKGVSAAAAAVGGLLEAVPSARRRLRELLEGKTPPRPAPRSTTILDPMLRAVGLHVAFAQRKLTVSEAELRIAHLSTFRWLAARAQEPETIPGGRPPPIMYTLHLGQQLKFSRNDKEQPRLGAALLWAVAQLKAAGYFKYLKFVCLHGLAAVAAAICSTRSTRCSAPAMSDASGCWASTSASSRWGRGCRRAWSRCSPRGRCPCFTSRPTTPSRPS